MTPGFEDVPVLHCHGTADNVVKLSWGEMTRDHLTAKGIHTYTFKTYTGIGHTVNNDILRDALHFLTTILPVRSELCLKPKNPAEMSVKELKQAIRTSGLSSQAVGFTEKSEYTRLLTEYYNSLSK